MSKLIVINGDFREVVDEIAQSGGGFTMAFADPPDNIGLKYGQFDDKMDKEEYADFLDDLIGILTVTCPVSWVSFNAKWTFVMGSLALSAEQCGAEVKPCVQTFTFGQNNKRDLGNGHRPLWRFRMFDAPLYPEAIKVPSWRQLNGDKRAAPGGRVPLDVFDFPRVTGNSKQRRSWHPTQLNEELVERCVKFCTREGDWVLDPFAGTGTTMRVCKRLNRNCVTIDVDSDYCEKIAEENQAELRT